MLHPALATRPNIFALMIGAIVLIACTLARLAGQPLVANLPVVAAASTLLIFLIPGAVAGLIAPRSFFWDGAILGMIAAAFVTLQSFQFYRPDWSSILLYQAMGVLACASVPLSIVGALGGRFASGRR
jgi:hypothetical protein